MEHHRECDCNTCTEIAHSHPLLETTRIALANRSYAAISVRYSRSMSMWYVHYTIFDSNDRYLSMNTLTGGFVSFKKWNDIANSISQTLGGEQ